MPGDGEQTGRPKAECTSDEKEEPWDESKEE
jgi:hypothetical protein